MPEKQLIIQIYPDPVSGWIVEITRRNFPAIRTYATIEDAALWLLAEIERFRAANAN